MGELILSIGHLTRSLARWAQRVLSGSRKRSHTGREKLLLIESIRRKRLYQLRVSGSKSELPESWESHTFTPWSRKKCVLD